MEPLTIILLTVSVVLMIALIYEKVRQNLRERFIIDYFMRLEEDIHYTMFLEREIINIIYKEERPPKDKP